MARHRRREKSSIANRLRPTKAPSAGKRPPQDDRFPPKFAHILDYVSYGGGIISSSSSEFSVAR
jgi:hypothetical protein